MKKGKLKLEANRSIMDKVPNEICCNNYLKDLVVVA